MGKTLDYLHWRGDLQFLNSPFNDVDMLILALLSYLPLKDFVPGIESNSHISLQEVAREYNSKHSRNVGKTKKSIADVQFSFAKEIDELFTSAASTPRFREIKLSRYEENTDFVIGRQFAAVTFSLPNPENIKVIAFRGTDNSIVGWKEDFRLAYMEQIPAHESARKYLEHTIGFFSSQFMLCGHSKGGNLAVFAGSHVDWFRQKKIKKIINFDGPGFNFSIVQKDPFTRIEHKVTNYVPEESMVGLLLEPVGNRVVITSSDRFMNQHDAFNWEVERSEFLTGELSGSAIVLEQILKTWLTEISIPDREMFLEALFDILGASEGKVINPDPKETLIDINAIIKKYSKLNNKTKALLAQVFGSLAAEASKTLSDTIKEKIPHSLPGIKKASPIER